MSVGAGSLTVSTPYASPAQALVDAVMFQSFYRTFGAVAIHVGVGASYDAAVWLSQNGRGGTVSWVIPGRLFLWSGLSVAPGIPNAQTMNVIGIGSGFGQLNTGFERVGYWAMRLYARLTTGSTTED